MGGMMKYFISSTFFSRLAISISAMVSTAAPIWIVFYFIGLNLISDKTKISRLLWCWSGYLASIIIVLMIIGWVINIKPNLFVKGIVVIGTCCAIPHVVYSFIILAGFVILPLDILACYLVYWYMKDWQTEQSKPKPALKMNIKLS
jgi:hypothetical protein